MFTFDEGDNEYDLSSLQCSGQDLSTDTTLKTVITLTSDDEELLSKITKEKIKLALIDDLFTQECE